MISKQDRRNPDFRFIVEHKLYANGQPVQRPFWITRSKDISFDVVGTAFDVVWTEEELCLLVAAGLIEKHFLIEPCSDLEELMNRVQRVMYVQFPAHLFKDLKIELMTPTIRVIVFSEASQ